MKKHEVKSIVEPPGDASARLYRDYTSTSALVGGDLESALANNKAYFQTNFLQHFPTNRDARILEIGCGYGKNLHAIKAFGYNRVSGVDFSEEQIELARSTVGIDEVYFANAIEWLTESDERYDCIVLIDVLEHLELPALVTLGDMLDRHLNPGGRVIVQVPNDIAPLNPLPHGDLTHLRAFTPQSMAQFFANAGVTIRFMGDALSQNIIRRILWRGIVSPLMKLAFILIHGRYSYPLVFSANLIVVAEKHRE